MPRGGARPGAGRKPGSLSKNIVTAKAKLAAHAAEIVRVVRPEIARMSPLDVMLHAMALEAEADRWPQAAALAKEAAPYLHPKLSSETLRVQNDDSQRSEEDIRREIADLEQRTAVAAASGTVAPPVPGQSRVVVH